MQQQNKPNKLKAKQNHANVIVANLTQLYWMIKLKLLFAILVMKIHLRLNNIYNQQTNKQHETFNRLKHYADHYRGRLLCSYFYH